MSLSSLPLSYCTNVHPGRSVAEVEQGLTQYTAPLKQRYGHALAAGLWLAQPVIQELKDSPQQRQQLAGTLAKHDLSCYTLNAFPYGDFHSDRVKEKVYLPDWSQPERLQYTIDCARVLAELLPENTEGSISTVPLGFKEFPHEADFLGNCSQQLIQLAEELDKLAADTGKTIRLAIEPEPFCVLETTAETLDFFSRLYSQAADAGREDVVRRMIGVCYDVCHQSVEFEDVASSIQALRERNIRINKVHITCAIQVEHPADRPEVREALARYVEPRYLHQTLARTPDGMLARCVDLTRELALDPTDTFRSAPLWRVHYHVPVNAETLGPLKTTREDLKKALATVATLDYAPHLEVETYTWEVLPDGSKMDLVEGLTHELTATRTLLGKLGS